MVQAIKLSETTSFNAGSLTKLSPSSGNITWAYLLEALANNKSIDILGNNMKALKAGYDRNISICAVSKWFKALYIVYRANSIVFYSSWFYWNWLDR